MELKATKQAQGAAVAESSVRKLRNLYDKYTTFSTDDQFERVLPQLLTELNATPNRRTGFAPNDVNDSTAGLVFQRKYGDYVRRLPAAVAEARPKFRRNELVRLHYTPAGADKFKKVGKRHFFYFSDFFGP